MASLNIPAPVIPTDIEQNFIENEPPGLFPMDQDSVWGQMRKLFADDMQSLADQLEQWWANLDPLQSDDADLTNWEEMLGIPWAANGRTSEQRKSFVVSRRVRGPFTNTRRNTIVESFIAATFNPPIEFTADGVSFGTGVDSGIPFGSELASLVGTYSIYQDVRNFLYKVWITSNAAVDIAGLQRELLRITPAGITFTIDGTRIVPIDYPGLIKSERPLAFFPLGTSAESRGKYTFTPTAIGAPAFGAAPGLLAANIGADGDLSLNGSSAYKYGDVDATEFVGNAPFSVEAWIDPTALDSAQHVIVAKPGTTSGWMFVINATNQLQLQRTDSGGVSDVVNYTLPDANAHHVVGTYDGTTMRLYLDGALVASAVSARAIAANTGLFRIGSATDTTGFFSGLIDGLAIYDYALSNAQVARHHTTGIGTFA